MILSVAYKCYEEHESWQSIDHLETDNASRNLSVYAVYLTGLNAWCFPTQVQADYGKKKSQYNIS